ncbi:MAG: regulatory protein RecX [Clostridia bacterium]|nr:regulatory protein RecX [Clostridia bacterium]
MTSNKPRITDLRPNAQNPELRDVYVDGTFYLSAPLLLLREQELSVGSVFGEEEQSALLLAAQLIPAKEKAYQYLGYGDLSRAKLYEKLTRFGIEPQVAELTCDYMEQRGYIDDTALAHKLARRFAESKRWGVRRILPELMQKGIPADAAREAVDALDTDFYETARYHVETKYRRYDRSDRKERDKVFQGLLRLGFDYEEAKAALSIEDYDD